MGKRKRLRTSGGYSNADIEAGSDDHSDGRSELYEKHQRIQAEFRSNERLRNLAPFLDREERRYNQLLKPVEKALNSVVQDRAGCIITIEQGKELRTQAAKSRLHYKRPNGSWDRLRERQVVKDEHGRAVKNVSGGLVRKEVPAERVRVILHDSFQIDPVLALGVVFATRDGGLLAELALEFLRVGGQDAIEIFEAVTGAEVVTMPYHSKAMGGHFQPDYVIVAEDGTKLALKKLSHLGHSMLGAWRWTEMGYTGEALDQLTGVAESEVGLEEILDYRGKRTVDFKVCSELDHRMQKRLDEPRFAALKEIVVNRARPEYEAYLQRRRAALAGDTTPRRLAKLAALLRASQDEVVGFKTQLDAEKQEVETRKRRNNDLEEQLAKERRDFEQTLSTANNEIKAQKVMVSERADEAKRLSESLESARKDIAAADGEMKALRGRMDNIAKSREELTVLLASAQRSAEVGTAEVKRLRAVIESMTNDATAQVRAEIRRQHKLLTGLDRFVSSLVPAYNVSGSVAPDPSWACLCRRNGSGRLELTSIFDGVLDELTEFRAEADEIRMRARRLTQVSQLETVKRPKIVEQPAEKFTHCGGANGHLSAKQPPVVLKVPGFEISEPK